MARRTPKPEAQFTATLTPLRQICEQCGNRLWVASHCRRKVVTLEGVSQLRVVICQCHTPTCPRYHIRYHPEEEGGFALPHGEFGLDIIALIGAWRWRRASQCARDATTLAGPWPYDFRTSRDPCDAAL